MSARAPFQFYFFVFPCLRTTAIRRYTTTTLHHTNTQQLYSTMPPAEDEVSGDEMEKGENEGDEAQDAINEGEYGTVISF